MKWLKVLKVGKIALKVLDESGVTIKGQHPVEVEGAIEQIVRDGIAKGKLALTKPKPAPVSSPGD